MKNIKKYYVAFIKNYKKLFALFIFFVILAWTLTAINPIFYKLFTNNILSKNWIKLIQLLLIFGIFNVITNIADVFTWRTQGLLIIKLKRDLQLKVFNKLQELDMSYHISRSTGSTISIIKRGDSAAELAFVLFHTFLGGPLLSFVIAFVILLQVSHIIALIVFVFSAIYVCVTKILLSHNFKCRRLFHIDEDKISGKVADNLMNLVTVKHFAKEEWESNNLSNLFKPWYASFVNYDKSFRWLGFITDIIQTLNMVTVLFVCFLLFRKGSITPGDFILVFSLISQLNRELSRFIYNYREFNKSLVDIEKYIGILNEQPLIKDPECGYDTKNINTLIDVKNVTFNYPNNTNAIFENLNLTIQPNEKVALVGKSGAGKTSLVTLLLRFYDVVAGGIFIDGINIKNFKKHDLRSLFGTVPQDPIMFNDTIKYNICYGKPTATNKELVEACKTANIYDFIESLPEKFETQVGERGIKLSGGQKQRLAIARVVLANPKIIVFDEATSQLDSESEREIQDAFWKINKDKTTIIIAHRLSTIIKADRIIVFDNGKIVEAGTHEELLKNVDGTYNKLWKIQSSNIADTIS